MPASGTSATSPSWLDPHCKDPRASAGALGYVRTVGRIAVLASGSGTILRSMLDRDLPIVVVLADRPCGAWGSTERTAMPGELVERTTSRASIASPTPTRCSTFCATTRSTWSRWRGFGASCRSRSTRVPRPRSSTTHPALLPAFRVARGRGRARCGVKVTGCTVHRHGRSTKGRSSPRKPCRSSTDTERRCTSGSRRSSAALPRGDREARRPMSADHDQTSAALGVRQDGPGRVRAGSTSSVSSWSRRRHRGDRRRPASR